LTDWMMERTQRRFIKDTGEHTGKTWVQFKQVIGNDNGLYVSC